MSRSPAGLTGQRVRLPAEILVKLQNSRADILIHLQSKEQPEVCKHCYF